MLPTGGLMGGMHGAQAAPIGAQGGIPAHAQQLMHPTLGPLQMVPITQMVQVMVPVLMPYPPPQPGQMLMPAQLMGQPLAPHQLPQQRPHPQQAGTG